MTEDVDGSQREGAAGEESVERGRKRPSPAGGVFLRPHAAAMTVTADPSWRFS